MQSELQSLHRRPLLFFLLLFLLLLVSMSVSHRYVILLFLVQIRHWKAQSGRNSRQLTQLKKQAEHCISDNDATDAYVGSTSIGDDDDDDDIG